MKKLFVIFIICTVVLYGLMYCYANEQSMPFNIVEDLPLVLESETKEGIQYLNEYSLELQSVIAEQSLNLNTLNYIYYLNSYTDSFDGSSLRRSMEWNNIRVDKSPLFNNDIYRGYYNWRTAKILKQYENSEYFDYAAFIKNARQEFYNYIKTAVKDQKSKAQLMVLLQEKLSDKLLELKPAQRKELLDKILALRQPANDNKYLDNLYQQFESRVRVQLLSDMVEMNKQKLEKLTHKIGMQITSHKKGQLLLQSKDKQNDEKPVQIINVLEGSQGYKGIVRLEELYGRVDYKLIFIEDDGSSHETDLEKAISYITVNKEGFIHLNLDDLFAGLQETEAKAPEKAVKKQISDEQFKSMESMYSSKSKAAREIIKELNNYSIYLELKDNKISNYYTRSFEAKQKTWKKDLEAKLSSFGEGGMADLMTYIKQFEMLDRNPDKQDRERLLIAKFRNTDIQFRKTEDCVLWVMDLLYRLKYMQ